MIRRRTQVPLVEAVKTRKLDLYAVLLRGAVPEIIASVIMLIVINLFRPFSYTCD